MVNDSVIPAKAGIPKIVNKLNQSIMKKLFLSALAVACLALPALHAQNVNEKGLLSKIEKSDADIADAKKGAKAATWLTRGKAFYDAAVAPTQNLLPGTDAAFFSSMVGGNPISTDKTVIADSTYDVWVYPWFNAYLLRNKLVAWKQTKEVCEGAVGKAAEAYNKAFTLDASVQDKTKDGLKQLSDFCLQTAEMTYTLNDYKTAADAYIQTYDIQSSPAYGGADPEFLFDAGYLLAVDGETNHNPASYTQAVEDLNKALAANFADQKGDIYYYLYYAYHGLKDADSTNLMKAKDALVTGIEKFPKNERILKALVDLYTVEKGVGDPSELIDMIDKAIAAQPDNTDMLFARGQIYYALKNYDEAVASFKKIYDLNPNDFTPNYFIGFIYDNEARAMNTEISSKTAQYTSETEYDADVNAMKDIVVKAIDWYEKAYAINPNNTDVLTALKQLTFQVIDRPGMQEKYDKYNALLKVAEMNQPATAPAAS